MDYAKIYNSLVKRAEGRKKLSRDHSDYVYYEKHHIIPVCMGGPNDKSNLVFLTPEEHWLAHLLLVKIYPGNSRLIFACQAMTMAGGNNKRVTNKLFGWIRRKYAEEISFRHKGRIVSDEQKKRISATLKGRPAVHQHGENNVMKRPEIAKKVSEANKGKKLGPRSLETKEKISLAKKGHAGLVKEKNSAFSGYLLATPIAGGASLTLGGRKEIEAAGFRYQCVRDCVNNRQKSHRGYTFNKI